MSESRYIVLTGATRGLGRALAQRFVELGHRLAGCGRNAADIADLGRSLGTSEHRWNRVDVTDITAVEAWAESVLDHGVPDLVINNAALINQRVPLWEVPADEFSRVIDVNIKGVANVTRAFLPAMIEAGRGVVINLSSGWGKVTDAGVAPYCATKFAIEGMTQALAQELPEGMAAIPLSPGVVNTDMLQVAFGEDANAYPDTAEWVDVAAPYILGLGPEQNGQSLRVPIN